METANDWEGGRKRARKLEGELDVKLAAFAKLCLQYEGGNETEDIIQAKSHELDRLLQELEEANSLMQTAMGNTPSHAHTLSRHRDILNEYIQERTRLNDSLSRARQRAEVLGTKSETTPLMGVTIQSTSGMLLRERASMHQASIGIDAVIDHASAIADDVKTQGNAFDRTMQRLTEVTMKYPIVNGLLRSIARRKSRDVMILLAVIATCLGLTIAYVLWK